MYLDIFFTRIGLSSRLSFTQLYFKRFENHLPVKLLQNVIIELIKVIIFKFIYSILVSYPGTHNTSRNEEGNGDIEHYHMECVKFQLIRNARNEIHMYISFDKLGKTARIWVTN